ncbi:MAG: permease-like cell division protein FtsX [Acidobacteriota bacterium]|nr:permease-like cell division protein FtsX [Acidobacteriota bacterium]
MSFAQALLYFFREALLNLLRSWKVSLLAIFTITVSLLLGGVFLLASRNLSGSVERWHSEMRVVIYLRPGATEQELARLAEQARHAPWATHVETISAAQARERFRRIFPSLSDLVHGWEDEPLPASIEVAMAKGATDLDAWLGSWRGRPEVAMVDDDREWLSQLETVIAIVRTLGLVLGGVLLGAAIFTIASIIRLTAFLHHEEIAIMRLVGATEFFIRGPFYSEGLLQGLIGGLLASGGLFAAFRLAHAQIHSSLLASVLAGQFLSPRQLGVLILLGGAAGLLGAITSLRRESL